MQHIYTEGKGNIELYYFKKSHANIFTQDAEKTLRKSQKAIHCSEFTDDNVTRSKYEIMTH